MSELTGDRTWPGPDPADITAWTLVQAGHVVGRRFHQAFGEVGLTPTQFGVLLWLDLEPGLAGGEIARRVLVTPQSMSELVASLQERGLVTRGDTGVRGQRIPTHLTDEGRRVLAQAADAVQAVSSPEALGLTAVQSRELNRLLHAFLGTGSGS